MGGIQDVKLKSFADVSNCLHNACQKSNINVKS